jgi:cytochrome b561
MGWRNNDEQWGWIAVILHWSTAAGVLLMFPLGLWMTSLEYYDSWYHRAPYIHESLGVLIFFLVVLRLAWKWSGRAPQPLATHTRIERIVAAVVHPLLYLLLLAVLASGYLMATADGSAVEVFGWFSLPALSNGRELQADIAGQVHLVLAITLIALVLLHILAAFKHHFIDHDRTLLRMLGRSATTKESTRR